MRSIKFLIALLMMLILSTACGPSEYLPKFEKIELVKMDSLVVQEQKQKIIYTQAPDLIIIKAYNVNIKSLETLDKEIVTIEAKPIGGMQAIEQLIPFPDLARRARIEGDVVADFNIDKFGNTSEIKIMKSLGGGIEEVVIDALNKTKFAPAKRNKENVSCKIRIRIHFWPPEGEEDLLDRKELVKFKSRKL
jgi:TonB family protein